MASSNYRTSVHYTLFLSKEEYNQLRTTLTQPLAAMSDSTRKAIHDALANTIPSVECDTLDVQFPIYKE